MAKITKMAIENLWESALSCSVALQSKPNKRWDVVYSFSSEKDARTFLASVTECCRIVRESKESDEKILNCNESSVGPFSHDTGGGKRNIRGTNNLS